MQVQVSLLCLIAATVLLVHALVNVRWFSRRFTRPEGLRFVVVAVATGMLVVNTLALMAAPMDLEVSALLVTLLAGIGLVMFAVSRQISTEPSTRPRRIFAVGAHPDDLELACGGTLAKFIDSGHEVHALVMSNGQRGGDANVRPHEAKMGGAFMGLNSCRVLNFPDTSLSSKESDMVLAIEQSIARFNPDIILTHSSNDQHQDHHAVHLATLRAARQHSSILCYESPSATRSFDPSVFVEISDYVDVKVQAVGLHRNQAGKPYMTPDRVRGIAAFRGAQARSHYAEAFEPVRLLGWTHDNH